MDEREDVVEYRTKLLRKMIGLGFLNEANAPTAEVLVALRNVNIPSPGQERIDKTVFIFHDESTFQVNENQPTFWAEKGISVMRPKSRGSRLMVSDFIEEKNGYLALTQEEYDKEKVTNPSIRMYARELLEYGEAKNGYWTSNKFIKQIKKAIRIADIKYPKSEG